MVTSLLHKSWHAIELRVRGPAPKGNGRTRSCLAALLAGITSCYVSEWCIRNHSLQSASGPLRGQPTTLRPRFHSAQNHKET
jgi:hypothetical protein